MLTNVRVKNRLPAEKNVLVVHTPGAPAPAVSVTLGMPAGVLSVAAQVTALNCTSTVAHQDGVEIVLANEAPHPRVSVLRYALPRSPSSGRRVRAPLR